MPKKNVFVRVEVKGQGEKGVHNKYKTSAQQLQNYATLLKRNCKTKHTGSTPDMQNRRNTWKLKSGLNNAKILKFLTIADMYQLELLVIIGYKNTIAIC